MGSCFPIKQSKRIHHQKEPLIGSTRSNKSTVPTDTNDTNTTSPDIIQPIINHNVAQHSSLNNAANNTQREDEYEDMILNDKLTLLTLEQSDKLKQDGYCMIDDPLRHEQISFAVSGYVRENYYGSGMITDLIRQIIYYYGSRFNTKIYIELILNKIDDNPQCFLVPRRNIKLSDVLFKQMNDEMNKIEMDSKKVPCNTLHHVLTYLGHHKGVEPDPLPCPVRSIHMKQIVSDQWDATYIDAFDKKTIFEIILLSNYLKITCLLHLGSAKIATLIKQLDQKEINRIIEEEERYRREHAQDNKTNDDDDDDDDDDADNDDADNEEEKNNILDINEHDIGGLDEEEEEEVDIKNECKDVRESNVEIEEK